MGCGESLFGGSGNNYIKVGNGEFVAIAGATTAERLGVSELRMPYKQILKGRIILKPGQVNYLLNFLGLGDNATFLAIKVTYNPSSVIEMDNYVQWAFHDDLTKVYTMAQMMVLTGNSTNRIKQMYLSNPNTKYAVVLDVMIGMIDDEYSFFNDTLNQTGTSFVNLEYTDIKTHVVGESIVIFDKSSPVKPLIYLLISNIQSITKSGTIIIIDDMSYGTVFLQFLTEYDANQAMSLFNYVLENPSININGLSPLADDIAPIIYFYDYVGGTGSGDYIAFNGATAGVPYDTSYGYTFSTSISLTSYATNSIIDANQLSYLLIDSVADNRDGTMSLLPSNLIITGTSGVIATIATAGSYSLTFNVSDLAQNYVTASITLDIQP